jgi:hypothetical protein
LSFALTIRKFCVCVANGTERRVEPFESEIIDKARGIPLLRSEGYEATFHGRLHDFFRLRKTHVLKAQNSSTIHTTWLFSLLYTAEIKPKVKPDVGSDSDLGGIS